MAQDNEGYGCKVDRVRDEYDLYNLDARLEHLHQNEDNSLRDLEAFVDQQVLRRAMEKAGMTVLDGEEENYYRLLTDDEVMESARKEAKRELRNAGVDVKQVEKDFVSYQTVRKHLNKCLEIDTSEEYTPDPEKTRNDFAAMQSRVKNVITKTLERLRKYDAIHIDNPTVSININVRCGNCNRSYNIYDFLKNPVCECKKDTIDIDDTTNTPSTSSESDEEILGNVSAPNASENDDESEEVRDLTIGNFRD